MGEGCGGGQNSGASLQLFLPLIYKIDIVIEISELNE